MVTTQNKSYSLQWTIILLCASYLMDFYNLTIYAVAYDEVNRALFQATGEDIQRLRISITNYQNLGVVLGAFFFGILGDKLGRTKVLKYSIFLYSIATLLSMQTHSVPLFTFLRFLTGVGLACEFATSNVLIMELVPTRKANWYASFLYLSGIVGGLLASAIGYFSWKVLFAVGGGGGLIILILRNRLMESQLLATLIKEKKEIARGRILDLLKCSHFLKTMKFYLMNIGFHALITYMFLFPRFMKISGDNEAKAVKILLSNFFIGGIMGALLVGYFIEKCKNYKLTLLIIYSIATLIMGTFPWVNDALFYPYCLILGVLSGAYPVAWIQLVSKSYGTNIRNTATNFLFGLGRLTGILFNGLVFLFLGKYLLLQDFMLYSGIGIFLMSIVIATTVRDTYHSTPNYTE